MIEVQVSELLNRPIGSKQELEIETGRFEFFDDLSLNQKLSFNLLLYKIKEGIVANLQNIHTSAEIQCDRCLETYTHEINISETERIFLLKKPAKIEDLNDIFLINSKKVTISLDECLRQEILLHFPVSKVCSSSCEGLCKNCAKNLNKSACKCDNQDFAPKHFQNLPKILKPKIVETPKLLKQLLKQRTDQNNL